MDALYVHEHSMSQGERISWTPCGYETNSYEYVYLQIHITEVSTVGINVPVLIMLQNMPKM